MSVAQGNVPVHFLRYYNPCKPNKISHQSNIAINSYKYTINDCFPLQYALINQPGLAQLQHV